MKKILAAALTAFLTASVLAGCNRTVIIDPEKNQLNVSLPNQTVDNDSDDPFENLYSFSFKVNDELLSMPIKYKDLTEQGWSSDVIPTEHFLKNTEIADVVFTKGAASFSCILENQENKLIAAPEMNVSYIKLNRSEDSSVSYSLPKDIVVGKSNTGEIEAAYGKPNDSYEDLEIGETTIWVYEYDKNEYIQLVIDEKTKELQEAVLYKTTDALPYTEIPEMITNYVGAEELSDSIASQIFTLDGAVYKMPVPVADFLNNGWELEFDAEEDYGEETEKLLPRDSILPSNEFRLYYLTKNGEELSVTIGNTALEEQQAGECYVVDIIIRADSTPDVTVSPNLTFDTVKEEVENLIGDYAYCYKEENGVDTYWIYVSDSRYISTSFDHETQELVGFQFLCVP